MAKIDAKDCKITGIQCYNDRADITRAVSLGVNMLQGICTVHIEGLVDTLDTHSVRVKGNKFVQILEVTQDRTKQNTAQLTTRNELQKAQDSRKEVLAKIAAKKQDLTRLDQKQNLSQSFADGSFQRVEKCPAKTLQEAKEIMAWYATEMAALATERAALEQDSEALRTQLAELDADIVKFRGSEGGPDEHYTRSLTILVDAQEYSPSEEFPERPPLILTYIVRNASWTPSYDVRINSEKGSMQLVYFAEVKQFSGEDWTDVDLTLSTANPSVGAIPTPLRDTVVRQKGTGYYDNYKGNMKKGGLGFGKQKQQEVFTSNNFNLQSAMPYNSRALRNSEEEGSVIDDSDEEENMYGEETRLAGVNTYTAGFSIPRKCKIGSDNMSHKVIIADLTLSPEIMHYCSPSTTDIAVYLQSKTKNTSSYELLPSAKVSVFLDGAFVCISSLKHCSPGSNFYLYLGTDSNVKCNYNPAAQEETKSWGMVSSSKGQTLSFLTLITNNKKKPIKVLIADTLPKSLNDAIKVELLEPKEKGITKINGTFSPNAGMGSLDAVNLAKENAVFKDELGHVLLWLCTVNPKEKRSITLKYQLSYPDHYTVEVVKRD